MTTTTPDLDEHPPEIEPGTAPHAAEPPRFGTRLARGTGRLIRRYPAVTLILAAALVTGIATGALWHDVSDNHELIDAVSYGLPPLMDGRVWTFLYGAFFVPELALYIPVLGLLAVVAGIYERRVGHWQTLVVVIGGQIAGAMAAALLLWPFRDSGWTWAAELGRQTDVGISAGGFAVLAALTAVMQPIWRRRVRVAFSAYLLAMLLQSGLLWDLEHFVAWGIGLAIGPLFVLRRPLTPSVTFGRRTQRAMVALVIAVTALSTLVEAIWPGNGGPFHADNAAVHENGVTLLLVMVALLLLLLADGLRRGRRVAWGATTAFMALMFGGLWATDPSAERTADLILVGGQLLLLLATYRAFSARADRRSFRRAGRRLVKVGVVLFAYTALGFAVLQDDFTPKARPADMVAEFFSRLVFTSANNIEPVSTAAKWFVRSIGAIWLVAIAVTIVGLIYSSRRPRPVPEQDSRLRGLLRHDSVSSIAWMLTWKGNDVWFSTDGRTAIGYRVVGSVALCLADPVGPAEDRLAAMLAFDDFCFRRGWIPCLFAAGEKTAELAPQVRWSAVQVAEDGVVPLENLEFRGKAWQDVRTAMNKAGKADIRLEATTWAEAKPVVTDQLHAISNGWVSDKSLPEMGFTLGTLAEADDPDVRLFLAVDDDHTVHGFTSWMPVGEDDKVVGWTIDLMRRRDGGFRQVMEYLIGAAAMQLKEEGYQFISLSAAPLAKAPEHLAGNSDQEVLQKLLDFLGDALEPYYGFRSLLSFKAKFQPVFHPMYLIFPDETALAEIGLAITRAYLPDAGPRDYVSMARSMVKERHG